MSVSLPEKTANWFMNLLGDRRRGDIGFIHKYSSTIASISLIAPVIIRVSTLAWNHRQEIPEKLRQAKQWVLKQIIPPENLNQREVIQWYAKKVGKVLLLAAIITAAVASIYVLAKLGFFLKLAQCASILLNKFSPVRKVLSLIETRNPSTVYPGYLCIALGHLYQAKKSFDRGEKKMMIKNIFAAAISLLTIKTMISGLYEPRWHHMSYGLLCMLPSNFTLNVFGGFMAADSMLYWLKPLKDNYDFSNIFVENAKLFVIQAICMTALEWTAKRIFAKIHPDQIHETLSLSEKETSAQIRNQYK